MNKSLFQISTEARELASALIEGELSPEMESALVINQNELQEKAINYGYAIRSIEYDVEAIDSEIKRLQALKSSRTNAIDRMKSAVLEAMEIYGIEKVTSPTLNLAVRLNPESVDLVNEYQIPDYYKKEKVTVTIDKALIKEDLKSGLEVPGAVLKRGKRLEIK
jgi:hypothetical protein